MNLFRRIGVGLWAAVGVFVGHGLAYRLVYGTGHDLHETLEHSGHGWLELARPAAVLFAAGAVGSSIVAGRQRSGRPPMGFISRFAILSVLQVGAFSGLEIAERVAHGYSLHDWHHDLIEHRGLWLLAIGLAVQVAVAALAALMSRSVELLASPHSPRAGTPRARWDASLPDDVPRRRIRSCAAGRAPPEWRTPVREPVPI